MKLLKLQNLFLVPVLAIVLCLTVFTPRAEAAYVFDHTCRNNNGPSSYSWGAVTNPQQPGKFCLQDGKGYRLVFQPDGNLVWYSPYKAVWHSNTYNRGTVLKFQSDSNIVIYDKNNKAVWASSWAGNWYTGKKVTGDCKNFLSVGYTNYKHYIAQGVGCGQMGGTSWQVESEDIRV